MGIMAIGRIIVLSALFAQTLSAPSGCIESCDVHHTSYQSRHTSGSYQDHAGLVQGSTNLNDHDYARPGNWTEHNQYSTDSGHGKVHEERGQYVEGAKKVRYYKKNFTSSYGNVNGLDAREFDELSGHHRYDSMRIPSNQHSESQSIQAGQTVVQGSGYNRVHSQQTQSSSTRIDSRNERLEDFGEYSGHSQVNQRVPITDTQTIETRHHIEDNPSNWSRVDSYRTDGGHGRVHEEEGQYVTGPKKVRYYKKNYTSSYSTSGVPQTNIGSASLNELHNEMQRNLHKELDNIRREFHQTSSVGHTASTTHVGSVGLAQETVGLSDLQTAESDNRQQLDYGHIPSTGTMHHYTDQQHRETTTDTRRVPYTYPAANTYGSESQRTYESRETYTSRVHPSHQPGHLSPGYIQAPDIHGTTRDGYQTSMRNTHSRGSSHVIDERQRTEVMGTHQSSVAQNQLLTGSSQHAYNVNPNYGARPDRRGETRHYEEHWSTSSNTGGNLAPEHTGHLTHGTADRAHYDRVAYNEHRNRYHGAQQGYDTHAHTSESSYDSAYRTNTGQLVTGSLNVGHAAQGADCTEETQHYQQESRYHRKYKRDVHGRYDDSQRNQDFSQEFGQQTSDGQQLEDLTQHNEQITQQTEGQFKERNFGNQHLEDLTQQTQDSDFTQQTSGKLEFGQQESDGQQLEDLTQQSEQITQQTEGQFKERNFGNQHLEDLTQQTQDSDFTQQTNGKLEFGQQTIDDQHVHNQHLEDFTSSQNEQHTQQIDGEFEFGQQTVGNQQHLEDLTQQSEQFTQQTQGSDDFTQQTSGKLEFGQQTIGNQQQWKDLTQSEQDTQQVQGFDDFTQQTSGKLEFGQQTIGNQQQWKDLTQSEQDTQQVQGFDDFTQQTSGKLEFGQQTIGNQQQWKDLTQSEQDTQQVQGFDDFTQQTSGKLEFGQQTIGNQQQWKDLTQSEQDTQQVQGFDDFTQQTSGKLEFGQQTVHDQHINNQQLEDLTQQSEQHTQQTEDQFELGQQTVDDQNSEHLTQEIEQSAQRTARSDDPVQQTTSVFEFGQQALGNHHPKDLTQETERFTQQTEGQLEFGQHTVDNQYSDDLTQQRNEQFTHQTQGSDNFTQQSGKLEFGQQVQSIDKSTKPRNEYFEEFGQQNEDFTQQEGQFDEFNQQEGQFDEFTQQTMGQLDFGQELQGFNKPKNQHLEDFSQQDKDLTQQIGGLEPWQLSQQMSQKTELNQDFTQQTNHDQLTTGMATPAPKPRARQRYQTHDSTLQDTDRTDTNVFKVTEMNPNNYREGTIERTSHVRYPHHPNHDRLEALSQQPQRSSVFDNEKENMDRLHWVHKSNDATVGLQWHYTYHPSDLTNIEGAHDNYYSHHNINPQQTEDLQQQSNKVSQQETQDQHTFEDVHLNIHDPQSSQRSEYDQRSSQQIETSHFSNQHDKNPEETPLGVIPLQHTQSMQKTPELDKQSQPTGQTEYKLEPRILQAYGGGPYDGSRNEDIYSRVTLNPSATLPPIGGEDPWDIREKPRQLIPWIITNTASTPKAVDETATEMIETTTQPIQTTTKEEAPPSFWNKLGHRISSTYDKAKEKAKEFFG
ncbi:hypothetical protein X777_08896 [Ooceraea biroi]|uniref:Uncharacterized protein n=1 Tax=Ooceraea biroi TaxID=2015173 RepID=A0A026W987_OOCBI|nr:hypothetical protein X777_08896 [Ooceraea biroi]